MRKPIIVATSPLTDRIYAGTLLKDGLTWSATRDDVTGMACGAVAEHVMQRGGMVVVTANGKPVFEITVRDVSSGKADAELAPAEGQDSGTGDAQPRECDFCGKPDVVGSDELLCAECRAEWLVKNSQGRADE